MYGGKALKTAITVIALAAILIIVTYLVFVEWFPAKPAVEELQVRVEETGETVKVETPGPQKVEQKGDWITVEGIWDDLGKEYVGDIFIRFEQPPKHLKLLIVVERGSVRAEMLSVLKLNEKGEAEWTPIYEVVLNEGEYTVEVYFNETGPTAFRKCVEGLGTVRPYPGRIAKLFINGKEVECTGCADIHIPHIGGQDKYWHFTIYFDYEENFSLKVKILEKE